MTDECEWAMMTAEKPKRLRCWRRFDQELWTGAFAASVKTATNLWMPQLRSVGRTSAFKSYTSSTRRPKKENRVCNAGRGFAIKIT